MPNFCGGPTAPNPVKTAVHAVRTDEIYLLDESMKSELDNYRTYQTRSYICVSVSRRRRRFGGAARLPRSLHKRHRHRRPRQSPRRKSRCDSGCPAAKAVAAKAPQTEGCVKCHNNIEPMHRYNASGDVYDKLDKDGKDAQGLTCTSCHGGNPAATTQETAHVQPRYPEGVGLQRTANARARIPNARTRCSQRKAANSSGSSIRAIFA